MSFLSMLILASLSIGLPNQGIADWASHVSSQPDPSAMEWAAERVEDTLAREDYSWLLKSGGYEPQAPCSLCTSSEASSQDEKNLLVCVSFSMPDSVWLSLSSELESLDGAFVLRGLPEGGFPELVSHIQSLSKQGVTAPILIDPILFKECDVQLVPTYVIKSDGAVDRVSGNISPTLAASLLQEAGSHEVPGALSTASSFHTPPQQGRGGDR